MTKHIASDSGFCIAEGDASLVADLLVTRIRDTVAALDEPVNRLYRGRNSFELNARAIRDVERTIRRLEAMAETLRDVRRTQSRVPYLQAAE